MSKWMIQWIGIYEEPCTIINGNLMFSFQYNGRWQIFIFFHSDPCQATVSPRQVPFLMTEGDKAMLSAFSPGTTVSVGANVNTDLSICVVYSMYTYYYIFTIL